MLSPKPCEQAEVQLEVVDSPPYVPGSAHDFLIVVASTAGANPEMAKQQGYEVISEQFIDEYNSTAILYRHKKTGAEIMSVSNSDEKKVFGIVFRTPA